ncbi:class I SAM-dependent methyltransferase [Brevibacterium zhoupengii]|uniref:class I SAM-dependent methyltransferase n=1 Tax=Brevibacterium zhoupengii TaxID=2898795 RepID=UPI001E2A4491|nr:class I SAM-dependent methyltransferase [Brevibacterium zhoupengii]
MTHSFDKHYWDETWSGERAPAMSSGDPNPHLINEVGSIAAGTALDAGCGAGAEAIWLATQGWEVTGVDVADAALGYAKDRAAAAGVSDRVRWVQADLSTWEPDTRYDLVTTHYAHPAMGQLDFYERIASWVAPGGMLIIVGHLHHHRHDSDTHPPAAASATAATITDRLDSAIWEVITAEEAHRSVIGPGGHPNTIDDVVVRAARQP